MKTTETESTQFELDWEKTLLINGMEANRGYYNLVCCIRELRMHQMGLKPYSGWKVGNVKRYFGIKGKTNALLHRLESFLDGSLEEQILSSSVKQLDRSIRQSGPQNDC
tara:strand:+ start:284 stop:610 length:327 start_codon:yes stop_codon:yes gene_type:complete